MLRFNEIKATQTASAVLRLLGEDTRPQKLVKLLYLIDREALLRWGRPITTDSYILTSSGPAVRHISALLNLCSDEKEAPEKEVLEKEVLGVFWKKFILSNEDAVWLIGLPGRGELSMAEEQLIQKIVYEHGDKSQEELVAFSRKLPECFALPYSSSNMDYRNILIAGGKSSEEISAIDAELAEIAAFDSFFGSKS